jgi:cell division protein FtsZ
MTINLTRTRQPQELRPRIVVFGVGGAGCNAVNNMIRANLEGVECVVANTDAQALALCLAERKIQLGLSITQGLGAGSRPEIGRAAAEEAWEDISTQIQGSHMVFITAGMGGGTGTGAAPVIARAAREQGLLTVGVVTKPFHFEGAHRMRIAEAGLDELQGVVDTLIVIPNQNLFRIANEKTTFADAFHMADQVLHSGVRGITDLMVMPGLINLDFADIRTVMSEMGKAMMGSGEAEGANRAVDAAERAISNPLLDDASMAGARGLLINITGGPDLTLFEVDEAANRVRDEVDPQANIIFGSAFDDALKGRIRVSVFATGIDSQVATRGQPESGKATAARPLPVRAPIGGDVDAALVKPAAPVERPRPPAYAPAAAVAPSPAAAIRHPSPTVMAPAARAVPAAVEAVAARPAPIPARYEAARREAAQPATAGSLALQVERDESIALPAAAPLLPPEAAPRSASVSEQPDMFAGSVATRDAAPARRPSPAGPIVAHVDDLEPERSSPEAPARRVEAPRLDAPARSARPSIFNLWRSRRGDDDTGKSEPATGAPTLVTGQAMAPRAMASRPAAPVPAPTPPIERGAKAASPPAEAPARRIKDDDVLEIPAFLRRQAN